MIHEANEAQEIAEEIMRIAEDENNLLSHGMDTDPNMLLIRIEFIKTRIDRIESKLNRLSPSNTEKMQLQTIATIKARLTALQIKLEQYRSIKNE